MNETILTRNNAMSLHEFLEGFLVDPSRKQTKNMFLMISRRFFFVCSLTPTKKLVFLMILERRFPCIWKSTSPMKSGGELCERDIVFLLGDANGGRGRNSKLRRDSRRTRRGCDRSRHENHVEQLDEMIKEEDPSL